MKSLNPLGAVELFTKSKEMTAVTLMSLINTVSETQAGLTPAEIPCEMHRVHTLGWDAFQRGRWESINSVFRTSGFLFTMGSLSLGRTFGPQNAYYIAHVGYALMTLWLAFATKPWQFFVTLPLCKSKYSRSVSWHAHVKALGVHV